MTKEHEYLTNFDIRYKEAIRLGTRNGSGFEVFKKPGMNLLTAALSVFCAILVAIIAGFWTIAIIGFSQ